MVKHEHRKAHASGASTPDASGASTPDAVVAHGWPATTCPADDIDSTDAACVVGTAAHAGVFALEEQAGSEEEEQEEDNSEEKGEQEEAREDLHGLQHQQQWASASTPANGGSASSPANANSEDTFPKLQLAAAAPQAHPRRPWKRVINAPLRREQRVFYSMDGTQVRVGSHLDPVVAIARSIGVRREFVQIHDCTYIVTYEGVASVSASTPGTSFVLPPGACELCGLELGLDAGHVLREGEFGTMQWAADQGSGGSLAKLAETISKDWLAWCGDNTFCCTCWTTRAYLFMFCAWEEYPHTRWVALLHAWMDNQDRIEEEADPGLAEKRKKTCEENELYQALQELSMSWQQQQQD